MKKQKTTEVSLKKDQIGRVYKISDSHGNRFIAVVLDQRTQKETRVGKTKDWGYTTEKSAKDYLTKNYG